MDPTPGVDEFLLRVLPFKARRWLASMLTIVGGIAGLGAAPSLGLTAGPAALIGAACGFLVIPLLIVAVKLVVGAAMFAVAVVIAGVVSLIVYGVMAALLV